MLHPFTLLLLYVPLIIMSDFCFLLVFVSRRACALRGSHVEATRGGVHLGDCDCDRWVYHECRSFLSLNGLRYMYVHGDCSIAVSWAISRPQYSGSLREVTVTERLEGRAYICISPDSYSLRPSDPVSRVTAVLYSNTLRAIFFSNISRINQKVANNHVSCQARQKKSQGLGGRGTCMKH